MSSIESAGVSFRIHALGHPSLEVMENGAVSYAVGPGKPLALVTYLALASRRTESRDVLCDLLWGDRTPELARRQLRQALWLVKTEIHPELLAASSSFVSLTADLSLDADEFLAAIEADRLSCALDLYKGDFFSDYAAPGAGRFEEWANLERTRLRGRFIHAAEIAARRALDAGKFASALSFANRIRAIAPHAQSGWRLILEARVASGDHIGALADAEQFEEWLKTEEWEAEPASLAAIRAARNIKSQSQARVADDIITELVGREKEFASLSAEWDRVQSGSVRFVQVIGDSGLGKTRLVSDFVSRIRASRGRARLVRANYGEREIPFSFVAAIAADLASLSGSKGVAEGSAQTLVALNPSLTSTFTDVPSTDRHITSLQTGLALVDLAGAITDDKPLALVLDDLHWADSSSREAISVMAARLSSERLLVVITSRAHYGTPISRDECRTLRLEPLGEVDVRALVSSAGRLPEDNWPATFIRMLREASGGNPLRVIESLRYCLDLDLLSRENDCWLCRDAESLRTAFNEQAGLNRRLQSLPESHIALLRVLAVAGIPLPRSIVVKTAALQTYDSERIISDLELGGLLSGDGDSIELHHDSIAEQLAHFSDAETLERVHLRLGASMATSEAQQWQSKSVQHLAQAGAWTAAARQAARTLNASNSREGVDAGLRLLLGAANNQQSLERVRRELPFTFRHPRWRQAALLSIVPIALTAGALAIRSLTPKPFRDDTELVVVRAVSPEAKALFEYALDRDHWDPSAPLHILGKRTSTFRRLSGHWVTPRPGCFCWAVDAVYPDSGEGEIDLVSADGSVTRLTKSPGADIPASFSPDGRLLLFLTTRWSSVGWSELAVLNIETGRVIRLTHDSQKHEGATWSPDGTRLAFRRHSESENSDAICVIDTDGRNERCLSDSRWKQAGTFGWASDHQVIVAITPFDSSASVVMQLDVDSWKLTTSDFPPNSDITVDPTARWIVVRPFDQVAPKIAPIDRFNLAKLLDSVAQNEVMFSLPRLPSGYVDRVGFEVPMEPLDPNVPYLLHPIAWTHDGRRTRLRVARWRSLTPSIATIDSLGVLTGRTSGDAVVELSAGGWRIATDTVRIRSQNAETVFEERWNSGLAKNWLPFGEPRPIIQHHDTSYTLDNNGDGNFFSGVYSKIDVSADKGVAIDVILSTPITRTQWQMILVFLAGKADASRLDAWDRRTGYIDSGSEFSCAFTYPFGEGQMATSRSSWYEGMKVALGDKSFRLDDGRWYIVRIQLLPDGRCGLAINGQAVVIHAQTAMRTKKVFAVVQGSNVRSKLLVGRLRVFKGVPPDVDWTKLESDDGVVWLYPKAGSGSR